MRIWIDTDIGSDVDDALTLAYVLRHPSFELVGISTVFGDLAIRTEIANRLLAIADGGAVPVLAGLGVPLSPRKRGIMFGHEGRGLLDDAKPTLRIAEETGGDERIAELATAIEVARPDVILAIGPLTNLGALVQQGVRLPPLAIMGGKLADVMLAGMSADIPEWNWFCDPTAVQVVLGATHDTPPIVVPAEVTFQTMLATGDIETLATGDELCATIGELSGHWLDLQRSAFDREDPRVALHDPLTAAVLVEPGLCRFEPRRIIVDDRGASEIVDLENETGARLSAAVDVDADALRVHLMSHWMGTS